MASRKLLMLCLVAGYVGNCQGQCYAVEGATVVNTCTFKPTSVDTNYTSLQWTTYNGSKVVVLSECNSLGYCKDNFPGIKISISGNTSTLTMFNASRLNPFDMTSLNCQLVPGRTIYVCSYFSLGIIPQNVTCKVTPVNVTNKFINCTVSRVYPYANCSPQFSRDNVTFTTITTFQGSKTTEKNETPSYYSLNCYMTLDDRYFIGANYFRVLVTPYYVGTNYSTTSETFVFYKLAIDESEKSTTSIETSTNRTMPDDRLTTALSHREIALIVTTAILAAATVILIAIIVICWLRLKKKKEKKNKKPPQVTARTKSTAAPENYNRTNNTQSVLDEDNSIYEEIAVKNHRLSTAVVNKRQDETYENSTYNNI